MTIIDPVILVCENAGLTHKCHLYVCLFFIAVRIQVMSTMFLKLVSFVQFPFSLFFVSNMAPRSKIFHDIICDLNNTLVEHVKAKKRYSRLVK